MTLLPFTRRLTPPSPQGRVHRPLALRERGWGEGNGVGQIRKPQSLLINVLQPTLANQYRVKSVSGSGMYYCIICGGRSLASAVAIAPPRRPPLRKGGSSFAGGV